MVERVHHAFLDLGLVGEGNGAVFGDPRLAFVPLERVRDGVPVVQDEADELRRVPDALPLAVAEGVQDSVRCGEKKEDAKES